MDSAPEDSSPAGLSLSGVGVDEVLVVPVQVGTVPTDPVGSGAGRMSTVGGRVLPAVRKAGVRLAPVVSRAATRAEPVAREAARRGGNALLVIRGADLTPPPAATPEPVRFRRGGRLAQRVAVVGALTGVSVAVWRALTTKTTATPDPAATPTSTASTAGTGDATHAVDRPVPVAPEPGLTEATSLTRLMASPTAATIPLIGVDPTVGPVPGTAGPVPGTAGPVDEHLPPAAAG